MKKQLLILAALLFTLFIQAQNELDVMKYAEPPLKEMSRKANLLYLQEKYNEAAQIYLKIADQNLDDDFNYYKLSLCYARLNQAKLAADFLVIAINNGFNDYQKIKDEAAYVPLKEHHDFKFSYKAVLEYGRNLGDEILYVDVLKKIKCRVFYPDNYVEGQSYPMIIGLHGYGSSTEDFATVWQHSTRKSFIFVVVEAPYLVRSTGAKFEQYSWSMHSRDEKIEKESDLQTLEFIHRVTLEMKKKYKPSKCLMMGFSQGTTYTYAAAMKYPEEVDGIICFAGSMPSPKDYPYLISQESIENNTHLKVFISHGSNDRVSLNYSKRAAKVFKKHKYNVKFVITDLTHRISGDAFDTALEWHGL